MHMCGYSVGKGPTLESLKQNYCAWTMPTQPNTELNIINYAWSDPRKNDRSLRGPDPHL